MSTLQVTIQNSKETNFITCHGDLVGADALDFKIVLKKLTKQNKDLTLDLVAVNEISLTGLNSILMAKAWTLINAKNVRLILTKDSKVLTYLEKTKMTHEFVIDFGIVKSIAA